MLLCYEIAVRRRDEARAQVNRSSTDIDLPAQQAQPRPGRPGGRSWVMWRNTSERSDA